MKKIVAHKKYRYGAVIALAIVIVAIGFLKMPRPVAQAQSGNYPIFPYPSITVNVPGHPELYYSMSLPSTGPFDHDFKIRLCIGDNGRYGQSVINVDEGGPQVCFTSPWASQSVDGNMTGAWTVIGSSKSFHKDYSIPNGGSCSNGSAACQTSVAVCTDTTTSCSVHGSVSQVCQGSGCSCDANQSNCETCYGQWNQSCAGYWSNTNNWSPWGYPGQANGLVVGNNGWANMTVIQGDALPNGEVITNLKLGLQLDEGHADQDAGSMNYDDQISNCHGYNNDPNAAPQSTGAEYTPIADGVGTYSEKCNLLANNTPDVARMYMSDIIESASPSQSNIPASTTVSQKITTGTDGQPVEITGVNSGSSPWVSNGFTLVPGSEKSGSTCDGGFGAAISGFDCPVDTDAPGTSCTVSVNNSNSSVLLKHVSGSFTPGSDPVQYTRTTQNSCSVLPVSAQQCVNYNRFASDNCQSDKATCESGARGYCSNANNNGNIPGCQGNSCSCSGNSEVCTSQCGGQWHESCSGQWRTYSTSTFGVNPNVPSGAPATFMLQSLTAPNKVGNYTESWQMSVNGTTFPTLINIPIAVLAGGSTPTSTPVPTVEISVTSSTITLGDSTTLTWSSTNAASCTASGAWSGSKDTKGSQVETPAATGTPTYILECRGAGGSATATASAAVTVVAPPPTGTVTVTSENSQISSLLVPASWRVPGSPTVEALHGITPGMMFDICDEADINPICAGMSATYNSQPALDSNGNDGLGYTVAGARLSTKYVGLYRFHGVKETPIARGASRGANGIEAMVLAFSKNLFMPTAAASTCSNASSCYDSSSAPNSFSAGTLFPDKSLGLTILWDPIANIGVSSTMALTAPYGVLPVTKDITVSNSGTQGSELTWIATSDSSWLSVSPSSDVTELAKDATDTVTITANPSGLGVGTHKGTITFNGNSIVDYSFPQATLTVTLTVTNTNNVPTYYLCTDQANNTCATTSTPGYDTCAAACAATSTPYFTCVDNTCAQTATPGYDSCAQAGCEGTSGYVCESDNQCQYVVSGRQYQELSACTTACVSQPPPPVCTGPDCPVCSPSLTASPTSIVVPLTSNLQFNCSRVTECQVTQGNNTLKTFGDGVTETSLNGTVVVAPSVTTTYTLSCVNSNGSVSSNAKVTVSGSSRCEQNPNGAGCPGR